MIFPNTKGTVLSVHSAVTGIEGFTSHRITPCQSPCDVDYDPRRMDSVRVSKNDQGMFSQCREIVLKLVDEFGKFSLPQE